jgi:uncharacterized membrane protein
MKKTFLILIALMATTILYAQEIASPPVKYFPNYHPLIVHFPIVLLIVAAIMQIGVLFFRSKAYNYAVIALTLAGFLGGLLAATLFHADPAPGINAKAHEIFEMHENLAFATIWISGIASLFKIAGLFTYKKWLEVVSLLLLLACATTVSIAGHHGAELVYKQGIGPKGDYLEKEHEH